MPREIVVQAELGGLSIAFTESETDGRDANAILDDATKAIGRQRAKQTLTEKLVDMLACDKALASLPQREAEAIRARADEGARLRASFAAANTLRPRRRVEGVEFTEQQAATLTSFEAETEQVRKKFSEEKQGLELNRPILEAQIARLRAVIAGRDPTEALEIEMGSLQAAE